MASTPFFFFLGLLFLAWFTADVHSVKVIDVLKDSTVVLHPVEAVTSITTITWKHNDDLAVDWFGGNPTFYRIFNDTCSLNTETGELTINNVRLEHSGVYTPDINGKTRSAMKLRVFSPVPKPNITHDCVPGKTPNCTLSCLFDRTDDLGDVEVFWILDDRHGDKGTELQITEDTKTETFICSLKNLFSSENSTKLQNPLLPMKVIDVLKGSTVILPPVESVTSITTITWKHGSDLAVDWFGGNKAFYRIFKDNCSLNTETGELTINNVRPEHSGVYTPEINGKTRSAMKLRVLSPVPKPTIIHDCYPGKTNCTLSCTLTCNLTCFDTCRINTAGDLGDVEVFWILDDRHRENGPELQITKDTKTFICSLKNSVSSENSTILQNPLLSSVPVWKPVVITLAVVAVIALLAGWIYLKHRRYKINKEIQETMPEEECYWIIIEILKTLPLTDVDLALINVDKVILGTLREGNKRNLSEDSILMLLTARYVILRFLRQRYEVQKSLKNVKEIMEKFFKGTDDLGLSDDVKPTLHHVYVMIFKILDKRKELQLSKDEYKELQDVNEVIFRTPREGNKINLSADENKELQKAVGVIFRILREANERNLPDDENKELQKAHEVILGILREANERNLSEDKQSRLNGEEPRQEERRPLNAASNDTSRPRDPAADPLISCSRFEAEDKV